MHMYIYAYAHNLFSQIKDLEVKLKYGLDTHIQTWRQ